MADAHCFKETWNQLDGHEEKRTLDADSALKDITVIYKSLKSSLPKIAKTEAEIKEKEARSELRNSLPSNFPIAAEELIDFNFFRKLLNLVKSDRHIPYCIVKRILMESLKLFQSEMKAVNEITVPTTEDGTLVIVGDLHGQLPDIFTIFDLVGFPSESKTFIFNGDLVDRGPHGIEVLLLVYTLKLSFPKHVFINRGNHELKRMNEKYDLVKQVVEKYSSSMYDLINTTFWFIPFCSVVDKKLFVVHGGLWPFADVTLEELKNLTGELGKELPSHKDVATREQVLVECMMWSDPIMDPKAVNLRGAGYCFGEDSVIKFLSNNGLDLVVRSHQLFDEGYMSHFSNRMMTVFSCSYYAGKNTNKGSVLVYANSNRAKPDFWRTPTIHQYYGSVLMKSSKAKNLEEVQKQDSLKKLYELIYDNSHNLKLEFEKFSVDIDSEKKGFVEYLTWESLMTTQLKLNIEWKTLFHYLVPNDAFLLQSGTTYISYAKFLGRYRINLDNRLTEWQDDVTNSLVTYFVVNNTPLEQAFKNYDSNGDGVISYLEFWEALSKHNLGSILTQLQCNELMSTIDINRDGSIDWKEFKQYFHAKFDRFNNASEKIKNIVADLSKQLIPKHKSIKNSFLVFDADHNGRISFQEFQKVLNRDLDAPKDEPTQKELFEYVDENSSGTISYKEFKTAFEGANAEKFSKRQHFEVSAKNIFMYHLCEAIRTSKTKLEALWLPKSKNGIIKGSDFALGLKALNDTLAQQPQLASHQIADEQMKKLQSILEKNGMVDFRSFLKMFEVKLYVPETQPPPKT